MRARVVIANVCGWLAALCAAGMMLVTVADVALRSFANYPIRGTVEIVELLLTYTFFLALPAIFLRDENIVGFRRDGQTIFYSLQSGQARALVRFSDGSQQDVTFAGPGRILYFTRDMELAVVD